MNIKKSLPSCVGFGVATWCAFAALEILGFTLVPVLAGYYHLVEPFYWRFTAVLLLLYLGAGVLFGLVTGLWIERKKRDADAPLCQGTATFFLASFYTLNIVLEARRWELAEKVALGTGIAVLLVLAASIVFQKRSRSVQAMGDPWLASSVLLGVPLLAGAANFRNILAFVLALACIGFISRRYLYHVSGSLNLPLRQLAVSAGALAVIVAVTAVSGRQGVPSPKSVTSVKSVSLKNPNVLWVVMDTVRADHLSLYGYDRKTTPNLDAFAKEATVYTQAKSSANWTLPSHASMFTGLYARAHGANIYAHQVLPSGLSNKFQTVAELLSSAGYLSMAEIANSFITPEYGLHQGFHIFDVRELAPWVRQRDTYLPRQTMRRVMDLFLWTHEFDRVVRPAADITTDAIQLMNSATARKQPFFLFVNYMDAHEPTVPPAPYDTLFPGKNREMIRTHYMAMVNAVIAKQRSMSAEEHAHYTSQYDGAIRYIDDQLVRLFARLRESGIYDNTLIVITSDHGEALGERNFVGHRQSLYQDQIYVPLVIKYPGQNQGRTDERVVSNVDLMPTVMKSVGLPAPAGIHGRNLLSPAWGAERAISAEAYLHQALANLRPDHPARQYSLLRDNWKLIANSDGSSELYDLSTDPEERKNVYRVDSTIAREMRQSLNEWLDETPMLKQAPQKINTRTMDRLKALGYVQ